MTTEPRRDAESASQEIERLEREASEMLVQQETVAAQIRALMSREDQGAGIDYAQEIFRLSQEKLRLAAEVDFRRARANRLRLAGSDGPLQ
ncbi:hypothetical protein [Desulfocurvus sp. DL9XJH121]